MIDHLPREIALFGVYLPSLTVLFAFCLIGGWFFDRALAWIGLYGHIWHPTLLRASLFVCVYGALALYLYH
jgi:hypothetical protein